MAADKEQPKATTMDKVALAAVLGANVLLASLGPGISVWVTIFAKSGIGDSLCEDNAMTCDKQYLYVVAALQLAQTQGKSGDFYGGLLYQVIGGRKLAAMYLPAGVIGWIVVYVSAKGAKMGPGIDRWTSKTFMLGLIYIMGSQAGFKWIIFEFMIMFPSGVVMSLANAGFQAGSMMALLFRSVMNALSLGLESAASFEFFAYTLCGVVIYFLLPSRLDTMKDESKDEIKDESKDESEDNQPAEGAEKGSPFVDSMRIFCQHPFIHTLALFVFATGPMWAVVYQSMCSKYAGKLFHDKEKGDSLGGAVALYTFILCCLVGPVLASVAAKLGFSTLVFITAFDLIACAWVIPMASIPAQHFCILSSVLMWAIEPIMLGTHLFSHVSTALSGAAITIFNGAWMNLYTLALAGELEFYASHSATVYQSGRAFEVLVSYGATLYTTYFLKVFIHGLPTRVVILPEIERRLCRPFVCNHFDEVAEILKISTDAVIQLVSDKIMVQAKHSTILQRIDGATLQVRLQDLKEEDLNEYLTQPIAIWNHTYANNSGHAADAFVGQIGQIVDPGKLKTKNMAVLNDELRANKSELVFDDLDPTKIIRRTRILVVCIEVVANGEKYYLIQVDTAAKKAGIKVPGLKVPAIKVPGMKDESTKEPFRFPGNKMQTGQTEDVATKKFLDRLGMRDYDTSVQIEPDALISEMKESASYPGMMTQYTKILARIQIQSIGATRKYTSRGLKVNEKPTQWEISADGKTEQYSWMTEAEIGIQSPNFWKQFASGSNLGSQAIRDKGYREAIGVRHLTTQITRGLRKNDFQGLPDMISRSYEQNAPKMIEAVRSIPLWVGPNLETYSDRLVRLFRKYEELHKLDDLVKEVLAVEFRGRLRARHITESSLVAPPSPR